VDHDPAQAENFRKAFDGFQPEKIARYTPKRSSG